MSRPKLLKVRLYYQVEGQSTPLEIELDARKVTSLYFDEQAAVEILGGFYEGRRRTITKDEAIARFGLRAEAWFPKDKTELPLDKAFLRKAWGAEGAKKRRARAAEADARASLDTLPFMLIKDPSCWPSGYP